MSYLKSTLALLCFWSTIPLLANDTRIIAGEDVEPGTFEEVGRLTLTNNGSVCSSVLVGPRVALTTAHCVLNDALVQIEFGEQNVVGIATRSPLYPGIDHDLAIVILQERVSIKPASIFNQYQAGDTVTLLGHGCKQLSGNDLGLAKGTAVILPDPASYDFIAQGENALCFGDSGGPAYLEDFQRRGEIPPVSKLKLVIGLGSKGDLIDKSYFVRLDHTESQRFLQSMIETHNVDICGMNTACE